MSALQKVEQKVTELQPVSESATLLQFIGKAAADPNTDIDKMERLLAMHKEMKSEQAERAFNDAMSAAQAEMRPISADCENPQTRSKYASYAQLDKALRPIYTKHGFSLSFNTAEAREGWIQVLCYVSHKGGHTRTYQQFMPSDGTGAKGNSVMTKTHAAGSAMSYGMRYALKGIFNVAIGEDDHDGNEVAPPSEEFAAFADRIAEADADALSAIAKEIPGAKLSPTEVRNLRALYSKRNKEVHA